MWRKQRKFVTDLQKAEAPVNEEETQEMEEADVIQLESGEELIVPRSKFHATEEPNAKQREQAYALKESVTAPKRKVVSRIDRMNRLSVNDRLATMANGFRAVALGTLPAVMVRSGPGIGKTHTLKELFKKLGMVENEDFIIIKAGVSEYGDYRIVCHWAEKVKEWKRQAKEKDAKSKGKKKKTVPVIVFDDVPIKGQKMVDMMKALMDTYEERIVTWHTDRTSMDPNEKGGKLPASVTYEGGVIILTNEPTKKIDKPMRDRSIFFEIEITDAEMIERMRTVAQDMEPHMNKPNYPYPKLKKEVVDWICSDDYEGEERSMRTLYKALKLAQANPKRWKLMCSVI